jgi:hypothetical protein
LKKIADDCDRYVQALEIVHRLKVFAGELQKAMNVCWKLKDPRCDREALFD